MSNWLLGHGREQHGQSQRKARYFSTTLMNYSFRPLSRIVALVLAVTVVLCSLADMAQAQDKPVTPEPTQTEEPTPARISSKTAPVDIDGNILFEVTGFQDISAEQRAFQVSEVLEAWASSGKVPIVSVQDGRGATTIILDNNPLITVTKADAIKDLVTPQEQAEKWAQLMRDALEEAKAKRSPRFLWRSFALALAISSVSGGAFWYLGRIQTQLSAHPLKQLNQLIQGNVKREGIPIHLRQVGLAIGLWLLRYGLLIAVAFYITQLFPATQKVSYDLTRSIITSFVAPIFPLGDDEYSFVDILILLTGFLGLIIGSTVITNLLQTRILQFAGIGTGAQQAIATLMRYTLIALGTIVILQLWGLDLSSLALLASALGVGIGFGLQNIARDFGSGLVLLFERPIQLGDFIEVGAFKGTVDRIGSRSTMIKTLDQVSVIIPNSYFLENQVVNWSYDTPLSRISIPVGVSYASDPEVVRQILLEAGSSHKGVRKVPPPQVHFKGFGDSALNFELLVWIIEPNRKPMIHSDLNFSLLALLRKNNIEIPFPQRDLHVKYGTFIGDRDADGSVDIETFDAVSGDG